MDELSADQLRELEEQLYSQVHHQTSTNNEPMIFEGSTDLGVSKNGNLNRYWVKTEDTTQENQKPNDTAKKCVQNNEKVDKINPKAKNVRNQRASISKQKNRQTNKPNDSCGLFQRQAQKLQRATQFDKKKQKAKNARGSMLKQLSIVETVTLDSSDDETGNDEVVVVPLPPTPVYSIDDSDDDEKSQKFDENKDENGQQEVTKEAFATPKSKKSLAPITTNEQSSDVPSRSNSPNSVMSQDDFIGQNDRQRLLKNATIAVDNDLLVLTSNVDSLLDLPTPPFGSKTDQETSNEIECVGVFIKPTRTTPRSNNKQCYRVDQSGLRAVDVYESESDIVSDGVYSKGVEKLHPPNTTIRCIDESGNSDLEDVTTVKTKTKRLRKRRASSSQGGLSGGIDSSDSDENDGVEPTGVPFISRGPAVESRKIKKLCKSSASQNHMSDSVFIATLNSLAQGSNNEASSQQNEDDDSDSERFPTARDIAETVLYQQEKNTSTDVDPMVAQPDIEKEESIIESIDLAEAAVPAKIADDIEKLFDNINEQASNKAMEVSDGSDCEISGVSILNDAVSNPTTIAEQSDQSAPAEQESKTDSDVKYFIGYSPANRSCLSDGFGWDEEMRRFYNYSWGGENFRGEDILRRMNRDNRLWIISDADRYMYRTQRNRREKCINCFSFGHTRARCPKPRKPIICYMCGESGHQESRCTNTRCLRCGSKTTIYSQSCRKCIYWNNRTCPICHLRGHSLNDCPDKWRRYHSTTKPNSLLESRVIYNKRRYCCFCGRRGHLSDECRTALYRTEYPPISTEIKSHEKSYQDVLISPFHQPEIPCRLLFDPKEIVNFGLAAKTTPKHVYGRFLHSVGLGHLVGASSVVNKTKPATEVIISNAVPTETQEKSSTITAPDQVPEVSGSTNDTSSKISESLQMPPPQTQDISITPTPNDSIVHDSDSNYSFSDHFELPTSSQKSIKTIESDHLELPTSSQKSAKILEPLPDFIPLNNNNGSQQKQKKEQINADEINPNNFGISARYVPIFSDDESTGVGALEHEQFNNIPADLPCEAKIYISNEHRNYFQSNLGKEYLKKILSDNNLNGRLDKTIVGYALFINGLPADQEKLQSELELKYKMLDDDKHERSCKVPKNVDTLITRLRSGINQLYKNLGNASELCLNLNNFDKQRDKSSIKATERIRKILNMIFLGQAGLSDGDKHMDTLLKGLHTLLNNFKRNEKTPDELRNKIDLSYRMIFTPFRHKDYSQLLLEYQKIPPGLRNRLLQLKVEPSLLGKPQFNISASDNKEIRINGNNKSNSYVTTNSNIVEGNLILNVVSNEKSQQQTHERSSNSRESNINPVNTNNLEKIKKKSVIENFLDKDCQELLSEIKQSSYSLEKSFQHTNMLLPSTFWSRECLNLLLQLIRSGNSNPTTLNRLTSISKKAEAGELSYSDYRIVAELYNVTLQINKK